MPYRSYNSLIFGFLFFLVLIVPFLGLNTAAAKIQPPPTQVLQSPAPKSILLLYSAGLHLPAYRKNMAAFFSGLENTGFPVKNVYFEQLDLVRNISREYRQGLLKLLLTKYADKKIDLIITVEGLARDFILKDGKAFFPEIPLLAILSSDTISSVDSSRRIVQIPSILGLTETLKAALTLFPQTKRVFVAIGSGEEERRWEDDARDQFAPWLGKLDFEYSSSLTYEETLQRIRSLPAETIVLYIALYKDKTGRAFVPRDVAMALTKKSNVPVFAVYDEILPLVVGGYMLSYGGEGFRAAKLALDILKGHFSITQPLTTLPLLIAPHFNWPQLKRWGVSTDRLPKGSIVINRPTSIWDAYKGYVLGFIALSALQAGMIIMLLEMHRRRKKAELNRKKAEEQYRLIVEMATEGILAVDNSFHVTFANQKIADMLGYKPEEMIGQKLDNFIYSEDLETHHLGREKRRQGQGETFERRFVRKDGKPIWVLASATPLFDDQGGFFGSFAMLTDITERKRAEEALQQSEDKFRLAFQTSPDAINLNRLEDGLYVDINQGFTNLTGFSREDVIGRTSREINIWHDSADRNRLVQGLREKGYYDNLEAQFRRKDGSLTTALMSAGVLRLGGVPHILSITRDISERKRAEQTLRESEERYRNILESIEEGYYEADLAGNLTFFNDATREILGYSREELMGMNNRQFSDERNFPEVYQVFNEVYRTGKPAKGFEWVIIRKDGTEGFGEASISLMKDADGRPVGFRGIVRDVTVRKLAEQERQKLRTQLQQAQKLEAIGTLAGGIAHDFNNILMGIQGRASLMLTDIASSDPHFEHLRGIEEYVRSAAALTKQLLGFARGGKYEVKATDLNDLIDQSARLFGRTRKEIALHQKLQPDLWTVEVDRRQIDQVLLNLFVNAWQAMPAGGEIYLLTENVFLDSVYIKPHGLKAGKYVKISVTDTGAGMDEHTKQRLFDPFFTTKEMGRGTGLGLASVYGIIKNHGGIITVYSEKGHGSTFNIYLPASGKKVLEEKEMPGDLVKGEGTLLLVDDEGMILEVGKSMLERLGYEVLVAGSGKEALEVYQKNMDQIKGVILDMIMHPMSGGETLDHLKVANPQVKVLLSSGYSINGQAREVLNRGCQGFIQKPFNLRDLSQKLWEILGKS